MQNKIIVVSAINFTEGGGLTILKETLFSLNRELPATWNIVALVNNKRNIELENVKVIEFPLAKKSWILRLYYEWYYFNKLSKKIGVDLWFSLHDITPRVKSRRQVVYCHNPAPFYSLSLREKWLDPRMCLFSWFYRLLYKTLIHRNRWVIVQQQWIREEFYKGICKTPIVVAHPLTKTLEGKIINRIGGPKVFFYPAFPRIFKNFEIVCEAAKLLVKKGINDFEVRLTLSGKENRYSRWLHRKYSKVSQVRFIGLQNPAGMEKQYFECAAVVFPSKLETWGLPISEAKRYGCKVILADLKYAHETAGDYRDVCFFDPVAPVQLADIMESVISEKWCPTGSRQLDLSQPFTKDWKGLIDLIIKDL
jgi:glycosyltransferase involved in cell wall biosynthesis